MLLSLKAWQDEDVWLHPCGHPSLPSSYCIIPLPLLLLVWTLFRTNNLSTLFVVVGNGTHAVDMENQAFETEHVLHRCCCVCDCLQPHPDLVWAHAVIGHAPSFSEAMTRTTHCPPGLAFLSGFVSFLLAVLQSRSVLHPDHVDWPPSKLLSVPT